MSIRDVFVMALAGLLIILAIASYARTHYHYSWQKVGYIAVGGLVVESVWCLTLLASYTAFAILATG
jgi:hypothetical protein